MKTLDDYFAAPDAMTLAELSLKLGVTKGRLSQLRHSTEWPPTLAMQAETATGGALDAAVLSPVVRAARALGHQMIDEKGATS